MIFWWRRPDERTDEKKYETERYTGGWRQQKVNVVWRVERRLIGSMKYWIKKVWGEGEMREEKKGRRKRRVWGGVVVHVIWTANEKYVDNLTHHDNNESNKNRCMKRMQKIQKYSSHLLKHIRIALPYRALCRSVMNLIHTLRHNRQAQFWVHSFAQRHFHMWIKLVGNRTTDPLISGRSAISLSNCPKLGSYRIANADINLLYIILC